MATILLSAAGMAVGGSIGGSVLGLSTAVIGRAVGASLGRSIDERLLGQGSQPVESGRVDRFRLTGASEGAPVAALQGRMRLGGQVIWASQFTEITATSGGGKGAPSPRVTEYSYSVNLAIALCEGEITRVGRIWADGQEVARDGLTLRLYTGTADQLPDPRIEAIEGAGAVPAFRGLAYVVFEDLPLGRFGNRVPQFSFEVFRPSAIEGEDLARTLRAVALIPGTGDYALASSPVYRAQDEGGETPVNVNTPSGKSDLVTSLDALDEELPRVGSVSLVVSWFGDDLRAGQCRLRPKVEQATSDSPGMPWTVSGLTRGTAQVVASEGGAPVYGGTPTDQSVIEAIRALVARGQKVVFYPFILMDQLGSNTLPDPWSGAIGQPRLPWRGRITLSVAPGRAGSPDGTAAADAQAAAFLGTAMPGHFTRTATGVSYSGPEDWSLRRMTLHYANLCAVAGGVDAFCIGSELRGLTQIRGASGFPIVAGLCQLAAEVAVILPDAKIGYAADWSEYHGYQPPGTADKLFHLDPLWADPNIDFIGIDNYLPLSDWRDGDTHADAHWDAIWNLDYLTANVAGGELFDWYYHSQEARDAQIRTPITDGLGEEWLWRTKDIRGWWSNQHHDRVNGVRAPAPTAWIPGMKPVWFTEIGCAAIDKGTNEPNKFLDPKSSESMLPAYSNGLADDYIQMQYLRAIHRYWEDPAHNPLSPEYGGRMVDMARAHVWAWDARPWPQFPANSALWADGGNYRRGHWITGRTASRPLGAVVTEICLAAGAPAPDVSALHGVVRGYAYETTMTARAALQPLMLAHGFDAVEREGRLVFATRTGRVTATLDPANLAFDPEAEATLTLLRAPEAEVAGRVRIGFVDADGDYEPAAAEATLPDERALVASQTDLNLALTRAEARRIAERWLAEARLSREGARFALPPSRLDLGAGDVVSLPGSTGQPALYRIDRVEQGETLQVEAVRVEPETYRPQESEEEQILLRSFVPAVPVQATFLDLPLMRGDEVPHAPHVAMAASAWPGSVALYTSAQDADYALSRVFPVGSVVGTTLTPLRAAGSGHWDNGPALRVRLLRGSLASASPEAVLSGANLAAIGAGDPDTWELFQFAEAALVGPRTWDLTLLLRGQAGTDGPMPAEWPAGSRFVLMNGTPVQIDLAPGTRGTERHFRWGPAERDMNDPSWRHAAWSFRGNGLRPYSVAHLTAMARASGALDLTWIRRTRIEGDSWDGIEVPLGEDREVYRLQVRKNGVTLREETLSSPAYSYSAAARASDGATGEVVIAVAQVSDRFGPGPERSLTLVL